jgi:hypothetical protein
VSGLPRQPAGPAVIAVGIIQILRGAGVYAGTRAAEGTLGVIWQPGERR